MSRHTITPSRAMSDLAEDARALIDATSNVAGDKVEKARKRLAAAVERGKSAGEAWMDRSVSKVEENFGEVSKLLSAVLEDGKEIYGGVRDKAVKKAQAADQAVRDNPYQAIGVALGVGALVGYIASLRHSRNSD